MTLDGSRAKRPQGVYMNVGAPRLTLTLKISAESRWWKGVER